MKTRWIVTGDDAYNIMIIRHIERYGEVVHIHWENGGRVFRFSCEEAAREFMGAILNDAIGTVNVAE